MSDRPEPAAGPLPRRVLGRSGLPVTGLGLGLAALGRPGYINLGHGDDLDHRYDLDTMTAGAWRVLDAARAAGIGYLDAARSYGRAEEFLAGWLHARALEPGTVTVGSKWGYTYTADWRVQAEHHEVKDHSLGVLRRQHAESLDRLGAHLSLYQIHSATPDSGVLDDDEVLGALSELRDSGLCIGISTSGPRQADVVRRAIGLERGGRPLFDTVQATWNVLEPSAGDALAEAHDAGMGVIVKEAVANGRLTERDPRRVAMVRDVLARAVEPDDPDDPATGHPLDVLAIAAVLRRPWADVVLSGAATVGQLASNLRAVDLATAVPGDADPDDLAPLAESAEQYWRTRSALPWN
ncbi:MAG: aldo/keto reductase [Acidimicrobiales bacterium]|nr:aldo/keto reductase [Acidimicrobiales bacterium]